MSVSIENIQSAPVLRKSVTVALRASISAPVPHLVAMCGPMRAERFVM